MNAGEQPLSIPDELVARVRDGRATPLVGAGFSAASGIVSWQELVGMLRRKVGARIGREIDEDELDLLETPLLYSHLNESRQPLYDLLAEAVGEGFEPNSLHRLLAQMPIRSMLTTNWDPLTERAFAEISRPVNVIHDSATAASWNEAQMAQVVKLHGDVGAPESIVFGEDDYQRFYGRESPLLTLAKTILATRSVFALGFSMRDAYVKLLFSQVSRLARETQPPHYVVVPDADSADLRTEYLRSAGFVVVSTPVSEGDPYGSHAFLEELHRQTYSWAVTRIDRTRMLVRETAELEDYLGSEKVIRVRATMGPLAVPGAASPEQQRDLFGGEEQYLAEKELRDLCMKLARERQVRIRFIGSPADLHFVVAKGYPPDAYRARLTALVEAIEEMGEGFEFAPVVRPTDANAWIVANKALVDSRKQDADDQRLYGRAVLERNRELVVRAARWFDEEFETLAERAGGIEQARNDLIDRAKSILAG